MIFVQVDHRSKPTVNKMNEKIYQHDSRIDNLEQYSNCLIPYGLLGNCLTYVLCFHSFPVSQENKDRCE